MLPRRPAQVFRSRWSALYWAAGVIFFAVTTIGFAGRDANPAPDKQVQADPPKPQDAPLTDAQGHPLSKEDVAALKKLMDE